MSGFPPLRVRPANRKAVRGDGDFVLYWMVSAHRTRFNFALDRAIEWGRKLRRPLVLLELVRCGYRWASDRLHRFLLEGLADNTRALAGTGVLHHPYVEEAHGEGDGLVEALAARASVVVTDEFPSFFLPAWVESEARRAPVLVELVDGNGLLPMRAADRTYPTAYSFRRFLQRTLRPHLLELPEANPLAAARLPSIRSLPEEIARRWPAATSRRLRGEVADLPIDHRIPPAPIRGGAAEGRRRIAAFVRTGLDRYAADRNEPEKEATSGLSPYLHFGHVSVHEVLAAIALHEGWSPDSVATRASGSRSGWWGLGTSAEAFLDELVTWRELGLNAAWRRGDDDPYASLPDWALATLAAHAGDPRPHLYTLDELDEGRTHDPLWNATQSQLVREGRIHGYLRMLWGKKILEWSRSPRAALDVMIELNDRYAVDGRDPNSLSGILWVLGLYDRPWGPERPIFGTVRFMSSASTARKVAVREFVRRYSVGA